MKHMKRWRAWSTRWLAGRSSGGQPGSVTGSRGWAWLYSRPRSRRRPRPPDLQPRSGRSAPQVPGLSGVHFLTGA